MISADDLFMQSACQYYAAARFAMHAQCFPVCGNLFHHAVERFLKAGLAQQRALSDLKDMGHALKEKLWPAFKVDFPNTALEQYDNTIAWVDKLEALRYPEKIIKCGMGVLAMWSPGLVEVPSGAKQYVIIVSDIDDLIVDMFKVCSRNPVAFIGTNPPTRDAIIRYNEHALFLTTWPPPASC